MLTINILKPWKLPCIFHSIIKDILQCLHIYLIRYTSAHIWNLVKKNNFRCLKKKIRDTSRDLKQWPWVKRLVAAIRRPSGCPLMRNLYRNISQPKLLDDINAFASWSPTHLSNSDHMKRRQYYNTFPAFIKFTDNRT